MRAVILCVLAAFAAALEGSPDCSQTACPSKCQCAEQKCTSQITDCLNDSACAAGQACIDKCACGDKACLLSCAKSIKSSKAFPLALCVETKCGAEASVSAMPDCSQTACPSKCQCAEQKCTSQITDCLNDSACAAGQSCINKCACGDKSCLLSCAKSIKSPKAFPLALCVETKCGAAVSESAMPDCSQTACPSKCQCAEQKCTSQITDCLNDSACAAGQSCINKCACGDKACLLSCAKSIKSPKGFPLALCVETKCGAEDSFVVTV